MTHDQHARLATLVRVPSRISAISAAITAYAQRCGYAVERVAEWVLSDLAKGHTPAYVLGWLENTR